MKVEIIVAIVGLFGVLITTIVNTIIVTKKLNSELDFITGWRKDLSRIAGKSEVSIEDVYIVRAKLRFSKKVGSSKYIQVTNDIIDVLENILKKGKVKLSEENQRKIRLICMYLLKIQWENREYMLPRKSYFKRLFPLKIKTYDSEFHTEMNKIKENTKGDNMNNLNTKNNIEKKIENDLCTGKENCCKVKKNIKRILYYLCNIAKLLLFLSIIVAPLFIIHYFKLNPEWKDIVIILLVGLFSLFYILIEKE